jgi:dihydroxyacetone kinase
MRRRPIADVRSFGVRTTRITAPRIDAVIDAISAVHTQAGTLERVASYCTGFSRFGHAIMNEAGGIAGTVLEDGLPIEHTREETADLLKLIELAMKPGRDGGC